MKKFVYFAFNGELMCFMHVMLNALDMTEKGMQAKIIMEGESVKLMEELENSGNPIYKKAKENNLFEGICKACSAKLGVLEYNQTVGIPLLGEMSGHPPISKYIEQGYSIITI
jgi:hypothetical protein